MELALSDMIPEIDFFAENTLGIQTLELMRRAGAAVARAVRELTSCGGKVLILAGGGNNGGDGYAAACELLADYSVTVLDVFGAGQKSEAGRHFLAEYIRLGGVIALDGTDRLIKEADSLVDAIFGTGFRGEIPEALIPIINAVNQSRAAKVAVDIPIGVDADTGELRGHYISVDRTVALSYIKPGLVSFPAVEAVGKLSLDTLGIDGDRVGEAFSFKNRLTDEKWAAKALPKRDKNGNKGSFGRALLAVGSDRYRGAAHLAAEACLRAGIGYATFAGDASLAAELRLRLPELLFAEVDNYSERELTELSKKHTVTLIGCGSGCTAEVARAAAALLSEEGGTLILDADALNALAAYGGTERIKASARKVILTPHPLELSRLSGLDVSYIQAHRLPVARAFAKENNCTLLLKGAATVITDGDEVFINSTGSTALSKAGSGDVLAGLIAALAANIPSPTVAAALAAYLHGAAGDTLAEALSPFGVIPSDLPKQIAYILAGLTK